ncbi:formylmethanofuran dehydrogenase subunit A [Planctomycetia bacterium]|nr:formylmethanofuran dehydrogenase subunit A [Planctomycetia bacterium]
MSRTCLKGGVVYDPRNGIDGELRDVWMQDGRCIAAPTDPADRAEVIIDVTGMVVMPGGVDMHCHIAGPKVNTARKMLPDQRRKTQPMLRTRLTRSGTLGTVPSTFATGYLYAGLGYTTAFDAAVPPIAARHAHDELQDTPVLDRGFYVMMGNNHLIMERLHAGQKELLDGAVSWLLKSTGGYAVKLVNPGGVEMWKSGGDGYCGLDDEVPLYGTTPRQIIRELAMSADRLQLPHPVHVHCNQLGIPGNWTTTLETMKSFEGARAHLTHIQFHSYGGRLSDQSTFCSQTPALAEYVNANPGLTVDVGQVMFGETTSMTGDGPLGHYLHRVTGRRWFSGDVELEGGCGIVPITYRDRSFVHALQWAIGLEWYLLVEDPWQIAMSTDHPNGGSFLAYPEIIALLMDSARRREYLQRLPAALRNACCLPDLTREYSLSEIAIITRAAPARMLGLPDKGHLGPGADADVCVYSRQDDLEAMFRFPRFVFRRGQLIIDDGEIRAVPFGSTFMTVPEQNPDAVPVIRNWFERNSTLQFANFPVDDHDVGDAVVTNHPARL